MQPILFRIPIAGGIPVFTFGLLLFLLFLVVYWLAVRWTRRRGISRQRVEHVAIVLMLLSLFGSRLLWMGLPLFVLTLGLVVLSLLLALDQFRSRDSR